MGYLLVPVRFLMNTIASRNLRGPLKLVASVICTRSKYERSLRSSAVDTFHMGLRHMWRHVSSINTMRLALWDLESPSLFPVVLITDRCDRFHRSNWFDRLDRLYWSY